MVINTKLCPFASPESQTHPLPQARHNQTSKPESCHVTKVKKLMLQICLKQLPGPSSWWTPFQISSRTIVGSPEHGDKYEGVPVCISRKPDTPLASQARHNQTSKPESCHVTKVIQFLLQICLKQLPGPSSWWTPFPSLSHTIAGSPEHGD